VRARLEALPSAAVLTLPFRAVLGYLAVVFFVQMGAAQVLSLTVIPVLTRFGSDPSHPGDHGFGLLLFSSSADLVSIAGLAALLLLGVSLSLMTPLSDFLLLRGAYKPLAVAEVRAAAAGLAQAAGPGDAEAFLAGHPEAVSTSSPRCLRADALDETVACLAARSARQARRATVAVKVIGTAVALGVAALILFGVYLPLSQLSLPELAPP